MENIKEQILEQFEEVDFLPGKDKKLIGYAEMFGIECIPLYKGINYKIYSSPSYAISRISVINPKARKMDGYNKCVIGHLTLKSGDIILLYDREKVINQLISEYSKDTSGLYEGEEDIQDSAWEWYSYSMLGAYMDGIPAFAALYSK